MLGYLTDNTDYFKGNLLEFYLKKGVSFSGGTSQHYNFFKGILNYSIINNSTNNYLHDAKAGEFSLHFFPIKIQCILSIIYYKYEISLIEEYALFNPQNLNILIPSQQLLYNSIITNNKISNNLLNLVDNVVLNNEDLNILKRYLNINNIKEDLNKDLLTNLKYVLDAFNINAIESSSYLQLVKENNRLNILLLSAKALNYKPQSLNYLTEAYTIWLQNSNI